MMEKIGKATYFVVEFRQMMEARKFPHEEWDMLLHSCLKKDTLKHLKTQIEKFDNVLDFLEHLRRFYNYDDCSSDNDFHFFATMF